MPSPFAAALKAMNRALDAHLGEPATITPMAGGDFGFAADPARPAFDAVVLAHEIEQSGAQVEHSQTYVAYSEWHIEIRRSNLPAIYSVRKGDDIYLPDRRLRLRINRIERDDVDVLTMVCGPLSNSDVPR